MTILCSSHFLQLLDLIEALYHKLLLIILLVEMYNFTNKEESKYQVAHVSIYSSSVVLKNISFHI